MVSTIDGIWGVSKGSWGVLVFGTSYHHSWVLEPLKVPVTRAHRTQDSAGGQRNSASRLRVRVHLSHEKFPRGSRYLSIKELKLQDNNYYSFWGVGP